MIFSLIGCFSLIALSAEAAGPVVGMISAVKGEVQWVEKKAAAPDFAEEIHEGDSLRLSAKAQLSLLYFSGCRSETISGPATLKAGKSLSSVSEKEAMTFQTTKCEPPKAAPSAKVGSVPGALVLMGGPGKKAVDPEEAYKAAIEKNKDVPANRLAYAIYLENRLDLEAAASQYQKLSELQPDSESIRAQWNTLKAAAALQGMEKWIHSEKRAELDVADDLKGLLKERAARVDRLKAVKGKEKKTLLEQESASRSAMLELFLKANQVNATKLKSIHERLLLEADKGH